MKNASATVQYTNPITFSMSVFTMNNGNVATLHPKTEQKAALTLKYYTENQMPDPVSCKHRPTYQMLIIYRENQLG